MNALTTNILFWHKQKFPSANKWEVFRKLLEEVGELAQAMSGTGTDTVELELGDVMICLTVLSKKLKLDLNECMAASHYKNLRKEK